MNDDDTTTTTVEPEETARVETEPTTQIPEATETVPEPAIEPATVRRGPSVPTVVWGLFFAAIAAIILTVQVSDTDLDLGVTGPAALLVAGGVLVIWGIAGLGRSRLRR